MAAPTLGGEGALRLKVFTGTSDVKEFFKRFDIACAAKELTDVQKAAWLPVFLSGPAMAHFDTLTTAVKADYGQVKTSIENQFKGLETSHF